MTFPLFSAAALLSFAGFFMGLASLGGSKIPVRPYSAYNHAQKLQKAFFGTLGKIVRIVVGGLVSVVMW